MAFFGLITEKGLIFEAWAIANEQPIDFTAIAVGDGVGDPLPNQVALKNEVFRGAVSKLGYYPPVQVRADLYIPISTGTFTINEVGIWCDGTPIGMGEFLFAVASTAPKSIDPFTDAWVRFNINMTSAEAAEQVNIEVSPSVSIPTDQEVLDMIGVHNVDASAHLDIRAEIDSDISVHNLSGASHPDIRALGWDLWPVGATFNTAYENLVSTLVATGKWAVRDGSALIETSYPDLFAVIGYNFTPVIEQGLGYFYLDNPLGRYLRYQDRGKGVDTGAATRLDRGDGTTGDNPGTLQADFANNITQAEAADTTATDAITIPDNGTWSTYLHVRYLVGSGGHRFRKSGLETNVRNFYEVPMVKILM